MSNYLHKTLVVALLLAFVPTTLILADDETQFLRVVEDDQDHPLALQVAITKYAPRTGGAGIRIDLVSAIHIGDSEYYKELNDRFRIYDALLYELVAPKGAVISRPDTERDGVISNTQIMMKNILDPLDHNQVL